MPHVQPIEENEASPEVKEVFDDIKKFASGRGSQQLLEISGKSSADFKTNLGKPEGGDAAWNVGSSGQRDDLCSSECLQQL